MGTLRSGKKNNDTWVAGAFVYSGRPDPTWDISKQVVMKLQELWESLTASEKKYESRPGGLGYRGVFMKEPGHREWTAFNGTVSRTTPAGTEVRRDPARQIENTLLLSAPKGLLPESMFESGRRRL